MTALTRTPSPSAGMLALRLVVGLTFLVHGIDKLTDLAGAEPFFAGLDIPAPALVAPLVAVTETVGGALLILGLFGACATIALSGAGRVSLDAEIATDGGVR